MDIQNQELNFKLKVSYFCPLVARTFPIRRWIDAHTG